MCIGKRAHLPPVWRRYNSLGCHCGLSLLLALTLLQRFFYGCFFFFPPQKPSSPHANSTMIEDPHKNQLGLIQYDFLSKDCNFFFDIYLFIQNPAFTPDKDIDFKSQVSSFSALGLREDVLKALYNIKVTKPTVIQVCITLMSVIL